MSAEKAARLEAAQLEDEFPGWSVASAERLWSAFRSMPLTYAQQALNARAVINTRTSADLRRELRVEADRDDRAAVSELVSHLDSRLAWMLLPDGPAGVRIRDRHRVGVAAMTVRVMNGQFAEVSGDREPVPIGLVVEPSRAAGWIERRLLPGAGVGVAS